jgi:hypothetical protein
MRPSYIGAVGDWFCLWFFCGELPCYKVDDLEMLTTLGCSLKYYALTTLMSRFPSFC